MKSRVLAELVEELPSICSHNQHDHINPKILVFFVLLCVLCDYRLIQSALLLKLRDDSSYLVLVLCMKPSKHVVTANL